MSTINVGPQFGHRTVSLTYGADNAKEALKWYEPEPSSSASSSSSSRFLDKTSKAQAILDKNNLVPVSSRSTTLRSEARDAYAYYVPINNLLPPPEPERVVPVTSSSPPPVPPPISIIRTKGPMGDAGAQTKETSFKSPPSPPKPIMAKVPHRKGPIKPPFFPYGNGNLKPTNDADFMASYSVNPVLHKMTSKEKRILENRGHPVFESALVRLTSYNPEAYSSKGLAARAQKEAEIQTEQQSFSSSVDTTTNDQDQSFHSQRSSHHALHHSHYTVEPVGSVPDADVTIIATLPDGRREVTIQRNAIMLEDAIMMVGRPLDLGTLLHKQPRYRELASMPTVSQPQRPVETYAYRQTARSTSRPRPIQSDGRPVWNKSIVLDRQDYQHTLRIDEPYVDPLRIQHDPTTSAVNVSIPHIQSRSQSNTKGSSSSSSASSSSSSSSVNQTLHTIDLEKSPARFSNRNRNKSSRPMVTTGSQTAPQRSGSRGPVPTQTFGIQTMDDDEQPDSQNYAHNNHSYINQSGFTSIPSSPEQRLTSRSTQHFHPHGSRSAPITPSFRSRSNSVTVHGGGLLSRLIGTPTMNNNNDSNNYNTNSILVTTTNRTSSRNNSPPPYISTHRTESPQQKEIMDQVERATHTAEEYGGHAGRVVMVGGVPIPAIEVEPKSQFQQLVQRTDTSPYQQGTEKDTRINGGSVPSEPYGYSLSTARIAAQALENIPVAGLPSNHPSLVKSRQEYELGHPTRSTSPSKSRTSTTNEASSEKDDTPSSPSDNSGDEN